MSKGPRPHAGHRRRRRRGSGRPQNQPGGPLTVMTISLDPDTGREIVTSTVVRKGETPKQAAERNMRNAEARLGEWNLRYGEAET